MELLFFYYLPTALAFFSFALASAMQRRGKLAVGEVVEAKLASPRARLISTLVLLVAFALAAALTEHSVVAFLPMALLALVVNVLRPRENDRVTGTEGVRAGWNSRRYEQLEEWRLTGDHLRFKLFGQWTAVPLALEKQAPIRARLMECVPERENAFNQ